MKMIRIAQHHWINIDLITEYMGPIDKDSSAKVYFGNESSGVDGAFVQDLEEALGLLE